MRHKRHLHLFGGFFLTAILVVFVGCHSGLPDRIARTIVRGRFQAFPEGKPFASLPKASEPVVVAAIPERPGDLLVSTAIWPAHLEFTREAWLAMAPEMFEPLKETHATDGTRRLRNPNAERPGMLGVFGLHLPWSKVEEAHIAGLSLREVAARFKGNGTFIEAMRDYKRSFKLDFNDTVKGQRLAGLAKLNLNNLSQDVSFMQEALAAEYYRDVGVPACRTAYAEVALTIRGEATRRRLGLYLIVENPGDLWVTERFGRRAAAVWKPATSALFADRGTNWSAYAADYPAQTELRTEDTDRVREFAALISSATDEELARRVGEFLDLDNFAKFIAAEVLTSNYDSFIGLGQNYLLYLDRSTRRFGFAPWDLDHGWGEFFLVGSRRDKEEASIHQPWIGRNLFLERVMGVPEVKQRYLRELEHQLVATFSRERLFTRIDRFANLLRPHLDVESEERRRQFERAVSDSIKGGGYSLKAFIVAREQSVRDQLAGRSLGRRVERRAFF